MCKMQLIIHWPHTNVARMKKKNANEVPSTQQGSLKTKGNRASVRDVFAGRLDTGDISAKMGREKVICGLKAEFLKFNFKQNGSPWITVMWPRSSLSFEADKFNKNAFIFTSVKARRDFVCAQAHFRTRICINVMTFSIGKVTLITMLEQSLWTRMQNGWN